MNLYLIYQTVNGAYDTFDSAIVAAESEEDARSIHPYDDTPVTDAPNAHWRDWARFSDVSAQLIGTAVEETERGVICASFHAG